MTNKLFSALAFLPLLALAENDGFGRTPVMGYNTYNDIACHPNQSYVHDTTAMSQNGWVDLGYTIFMIDCGWFSTERAANGSITYNNQTFPDGIAPLSQYAISLGMQWGMYTGATPWQCNNPYEEEWPASQYHERDDALQFAGWNTVYVNADNCFGPDDTLIQRYTNMSNGLQSAGIEGLMVCEWGTPANGDQDPADWTQPIATSWRVAADIAQGWGSVFRITNEAIHVIRYGLSGPGHFGDMDLLEVGNPGMTTTQQASHFAIWAMFKSALIISTNVINMASSAQNIFNNKGLIAINQDSLGAPVQLIQRYPDYDVYAGPLSNGDMAVLIVDQSGNGGDYYLDFPTLNVSKADVSDLWTGDYWSGFTNWYANVGDYGSSALRLSNIQSATAADPTYNYIAGSSGSYSNGASSVTCTSCASGEAAGNIGGGSGNSVGGTVTYGGITTSQATQNIKIDYINCEIIYPNQNGPNARGAQISVNGGDTVDILFPISGYDWQGSSGSVLQDFLVELSGFSTSGTNTITISGIPGGVPNTSGYGPNIAGISVQAWSYIESHSI